MECNSGDENSDDGLQIVLESPRPKKKPRKELSESDRKIIECVEKDLEETLEEKAAKANLTAQHVKSIIKEVVTNEHVVALVRQAENPDENEDVPVFEPKFTRAKTKELLSTNAPPLPLPWEEPPKKVSEVQLLFSEDLQEDSSGDEYVPDTPTKNSSFGSQLDTTQGTVNDEEEEANIARRTRSKLSLSHTPLEVIEEAFIPPDITTDMYDMDCDDDVWKEFLKTFTRPLDEVNKAAEDEDHDPEYNILADEEIDEVDREELRADRAVTISRKEFNQLMTELFEFADNYESNRSIEKNATDELNSFPDQQKTEESDSENGPDIIIKKCQIPILAQQMRQHVQILTQNFLLTYEHPEFSDMAIKFKDMLGDIKKGSEGKSASIYHALNLEAALKLVEKWENLFSSKTKDVVECKQYVEKVIVESIEAKKAGIEYVVTFPSFLMETVSNSDVFIYPNLLPRIPFKSLHVTMSPLYFFSPGEESLIALFMEQAIPYLKQDPAHLNLLKKINMEHVCFFINKLLMPNVTPEKILRHIRKRKQVNSPDNPIKFFYCHKKAPPTVHYVVPMDANVLPPCKRRPQSLPLLWRQYIYPNYKAENQNDFNTSFNNSQIIIVNPPVQFCPVTTVANASSYLDFSKKIIAKRRVLPKGLLPFVPGRKKRRRCVNKQNKCSKNNSSDSTVINTTFDMLPDMPSLGGTPVKNNTLQPEDSDKDNKSNSSKKDQNLPFEDIASFNIRFEKDNSDTQVRHNFEGISELCSLNIQSEAGASTSQAEEKDNPDDINELMVASSTVKTKKEPSGAEKKRAKLRREFIANLAMATPDDPETEIQKEESFADAFFDKLHETLKPDDYEKLIDILSHYDENNGDIVSLFNNVQSVLYPAYKELSDEFLLFLTTLQAQKVGKLMPYFMMKDMSRFMKKLQIYFKDQPFQLKKILKCMSDLSENQETTMETIKSNLVPLFKGNAALTDWFLQIFPFERPPNLLTAGPHEVINDLSKELARPPDSDICETVVLPDIDDPYGGSNCICTCHNDENPHFKARSQHCNKCGLKFIQGKIFIQTGKSLRPAVVSFLTNPEKDHTERLSATQRKRSDTSPSKQVTSPNKENHTHEEHESDDDDENKKKKKTPRKRKIKGDKSTVKIPSKSKTCDKNKTDCVKPKVSLKRQNKKRNPVAKKTPEHKPGSKAGQQKRVAEQEIEYTEPAEFVELKVSSDHSGESGTECFESCQDVTNTESDDEINASQQNGSSKETLWTREEDKIILQAFRQMNDNEETFKHISEILQNRSVLEIKNRFNKLMALLQEMASKS